MSDNKNSSVTIKILNKCGHFRMVTVPELTPLIQERLGFMLIVNCVACARVYGVQGDVPQEQNNNEDNLN